jgi:zinc protease
VTRAPRVAFVLAAILIAAHAAWPQAPDRSALPRPRPVPAFAPPAVRTATLANGLRVFLLEMHKVPIVHVTLMFRTGASDDPLDKFGLANLTGEMLDEGAAGRTALEIADAVDYLGASLTTSVGFDGTMIALGVPVARLSDALPVLGDVALRPTFPASELKRVREEMLTSLLQSEDDPAALVQFAFPKAVYGAGTRYGTPEVGRAAALRAFTESDLRDYHAAHYQPTAAALVVAGDVTMEAILPAVRKTFEQWRETRPAAASKVTVPGDKAREVFLVDAPGAAQSQIWIGSVGVPRSTPDFFPIRVMNTILGGAFTSRLNTNLREEHGYAYGAGSGFQMRRGPGPFVASAAVQTDKTADALREFLNELRRIHEPVAADELERAKSFVALLMPRNFETTGSAAGMIAQAFLYDLPPDYFSTYTARVAAVTSADVKRVADTYIRPDKMAVVIVGDRTAVEPGVRALKLGPVRLLTAKEVIQ